MCLAVLRARYAVGFAGCLISLVRETDSDDKHEQHGEKYSLHNATSLQRRRPHPRATGILYSRYAPDVNEPVIRYEKRTAKRKTIDEALAVSLPAIAGSASAKIPSTPPKDPKQDYSPTPVKEPETVHDEVLTQA
jgi:hypothetical protein